MHGVCFLQAAIRKLCISSPENVPEKTPGAWFTKLSMIAPGFRERVEGPVAAVAAVAAAVPFGLLVLKFACKDTHKHGMAT